MIQNHFALQSNPRVIHMNRAISLEPFLMRSNTNVFVAIRNIGDSSDNGELFEGTLKESIFWLATVLGGKIMAKRFVIGIGRDRAGALAAIETKRAATGLVIELEDELNKLLADSLDDSEDAGALNDSSDSRDTWKGVNLS